MDASVFVVVQWPDCQLYMDSVGWDENSYLLDEDSPLYNEFQAEAYFVRRDWKTVIDEAATKYYNEQYGMDKGNDDAPEDFLVKDALKDE